MTQITRRTILGGLAATVAPLPAVAAPALDLQYWLDTADPVQVAEYHAARLAEVMGAMNPARRWRSHIDREYNFALIVGDELKGAGQ
ncbi:hypothetical protein LJR235_002388 [Pararhizobium sp. LjRoot235]|uniref:hypothetical protein n=1 Tax=Pararhizobium sp. LjRoot235 TaxID=3342291 RepID=UPI003ECE747F